MINPNVKLATILIVALGTIGTTATAFATLGGEEIDEEQQAAIEIADQAVHEAFPPEEGEEVSEEDVRFHQGLCAVGITTEALEGLGGCEGLPPLVESDDD
ncbi:MAG: hypothetical protein M3146_06700 [Thermoproteota archaeon]|nr:hypothetical protein [Thermoproteota archaeon]